MSDRAPGPLTRDPRQAVEVRAVDPDTGAEKGRKPERHSLIPVGALNDIARVYGHGATKYADHNWRKGYPWSWSYDALQRHLNSFWAGENLDPDDGLPHLAHAGFHVCGLLTYSSNERYAKKDDRWQSE